MFFGRHFPRETEPGFGSTLGLLGSLRMRLDSLYPLHRKSFYIPFSSIFPSMFLDSLFAKSFIPIGLFSPFASRQPPYAP
jgi:hypothetical protein